MAGPVDYERAWRELRHVVLGKPSHGQRDLLTQMAQIEAGSERDRTAFEQFVDVFGDELADAFTNVTRGQRAADVRPAGADAMPGQPHRRSPLRHEGEPHDEQHPDPGRPAAGHPAQHAA